VSIFVTGTDTGVGKTYTIVQLLRLLRQSGQSCAGFKPICCGDRRDAELLLTQSDAGLRIDEINPIWLKTPAAPMVASEIEKAAINVPQLIAAFRALQQRVKHVVVEGVGGWFVPIRADYLMSDLAMEMRLPVVIVAQNRLGCLNQTLLTEKAVEACGLSCVGVVLNALAEAEDIATRTNRAALQKVIQVPLLTGLTEKMVGLPDDWCSLMGQSRQ